VRLRASKYAGIKYVIIKKIQEATSYMHEGTGKKSEIHTAKFAIAHFAPLNP
jgi:hypothetical protein